MRMSRVFRATTVTGSDHVMWRVARYVLLSKTTAKTKQHVNRANPQSMIADKMKHPMLGETHTEFMRWAKSQGVKINGVTPAHIPRRGSGMIATRNLEVRRGRVTTRINGC